VQEPVFGTPQLFARQHKCGTVGQALHHKVYKRAGARWLRLAAAKVHKVVADVWRVIQQNGHQLARAQVGRCRGAGKLPQHFARQYGV